MTDILQPGRKGLIVANMSFPVLQRDVFMTHERDTRLVEGLIPITTPKPVAVFINSLNARFASQILTPYDTASKKEKKKRKGMKDGVDV